MSDVTVYEGETARLTCEVDNVNSEVIWYVNDSQVCHGDPYDVKADGCTRQLLIHGAKLSDTDMKVTAEVIDHQITTTKVKVKASHFSTHINDVMVMEGDTAVFCCEVRNVSNTVQWSVNGNTISNNDRYTETKDGTKRELRIHHCTMSDNDTLVYVDIGSEEKVARLYVGDIEENKRRWLTVGVALNSILCPVMRNYSRKEMSNLYQTIDSSDTISRQSCPPTFEHYLGKTLNYQAINGNEAQGKQFIRNTYNNRYDFAVRTPVDLAKLFLPSHMSHMTGFDNTCDISAALNIITGCGLSVTNVADQVREQVRNPWGHCNFKEWEAQKFNDSFSLMRDLVKEIGLSNNEEESRLKELGQLQHIGVYMYDGSSGLSLLHDYKQNFIKDTHCVLESCDESIKKELLQVFGRLEKRVDTTEKRIDEIQKSVSNHIPQHIQDRHKITIKEWVNSDQMYVSTNAADVVLQKITDQNFVVVTGNSGTGKTYTVRHTALTMEKEGYIIVPAVNPEDISMYYKPGCKTVFVFDDLCGRFTLKHSILDQWESHTDQLKTILKDDCCKILASCRLQVFKDKKLENVFNEKSFFVCEVDLTALTLSLQERKLMVAKYFPHEEHTIADEKLCEFDFLPFLCSHLQNTLELENCFQNPFFFFSNELKRLYLENDDGKRKCCGLILCILYNNTLTWDELKEKNETMRSALEECELPSTESPKSLKNAIESLTGVYIEKTNETYKINHDKLFDFIAKYFGEEMIDLFIEYADSEFITERFSVKMVKTTRYTTDCIIIPDDKIKPFMVRLIKDWKKGKVYNVFRNTNVDSVVFRQRLLSYLKELDKSLQRELAQKRDNNNGHTPLSMICLNGDLEFAEWIIDVGADVNLGGFDNRTPLHNACQEGFIDLVKLLLQCEMIDCNPSDNLGTTAFCMACLCGHKDIVKLLIEQKVDVDKEITENRPNAIENCVTHYTDDFKEYLYSQSTELIRKKKFQQLSGIWTCQTVHTKVVRDMAKYPGYDFHMCNNVGNLPLMVASYFNQLDVVKELLISPDVEINRCNYQDRTALYFACLQGHMEVIALLLENHADVNKSDINRISPLHVACMASNKEIVRLLMKYGADKTLKDTDGKTAVDIALEENDLECLSILNQS